MSGNNSDAAAKSAETGFSENELDDIMAEFASLDQELTSKLPEEEVLAEAVAEVEPVAEADITEATTLEEKVAEGFDVSEMDAIMKDLEEIDEQSTVATLEFEEDVAPIAVKNEDNENVLVINQPKATAPSTPSLDSGEVAFSAAGNMNFNVDLTIAGSQATLSVVDGHFTLSMNGVEISITEEGFKAVIEGGANFNIPFPDEAQKLKVA